MYVFVHMKIQSASDYLNLIVITLNLIVGDDSITTPLLFSPQDDSVKSVSVF